MEQVVYTTSVNKTRTQFDPGDAHADTVFKEPSCTHMYTKFKADDPRWSTSPAGPPNPYKVAEMATCRANRASAFPMVLENEVRLARFRQLLVL